MKPHISAKKGDIAPSEILAGDPSKSKPLTPHIAAQKGDIAPSVILAGDPLRAKHIAENYLEDIKLYTSVRNILGYTGTYKGERVSVQGTGMGIPSFAIYAHELIQVYDVQRLIRVGSCGSIQDNVHIHDVILAAGVSTDSSYIHNLHPGFYFAPLAHFPLLHTSYEIAKKMNIPLHVGNVYATDNFHSPLSPKEQAQLGILAYEMELPALYYLGARYQRQVLGILSVSDEIFTQVSLDPEKREKSFTKMMQLGLETAIAPL